MTDGIAMSSSAITGTPPEVTFATLSGRTRSNAAAKITRVERQEHGAPPAEHDQRDHGDQDDLEGAVVDDPGGHRRRREVVAAGREAVGRCTRTGRPCTRCAGLEEVQPIVLVTRNRKTMTMATAVEQAARHLVDVLAEVLGAADLAVERGAPHRPQEPEGHDRDELERVLQAPANMDDGMPSQAFVSVA